MSKDNTIKLDDIIAWKIEQFQGALNGKMPEAMQRALHANSDWQQELDFVERFYSLPVEEKRPSAQLSARFYHMLNTAQQAHDNSVQRSAQQAPANQPPLSIWQKFANWLVPSPVAQFAMLAMCFGLGWTLKPNTVAQVGITQETSQITALQNEVNSLTAMVAISMLQNPSATERLNGIAYSASLIEQEPQIQQTLLKVLMTDDSTSVKLAALKSLGEVQNIAPIADALIEVLKTELNPLVQINIVQMLLLSGDDNIYQKMTSQLAVSELSPEAGQILEQLSQANHI